MKNIFLIIIAILTQSICLAQAPNWEWKTIIDGGFETLNLKTLANGNSTALVRISRYNMKIGTQEYHFTDGGLILINQSPNGHILSLKPYYKIYHHFLNNGMVSDENGNS